MDQFKKYYLFDQSKIVVLFRAKKSKCVLRNIRMIGRLGMSLGKLKCISKNYSKAVVTFLHIEVVALGSF